MIYKFKASKKSNHNFSTVDIETDANGHFTDGCIYDGKDFILFKSSEELARYICFNPAYYYAHCGMSFDFVLLFRELVTYGDWEVSFAGSNAIMMVGQGSTLVDSFRLIPVSLAKASKTLAKEHVKIDLGGLMPWELDYQTRIDYLKRDCEALWHCVNNFFKLISEHFVKVTAPTLPSLALKIWRNTLKHDVMTTRNKHVLDFEKQSYFGGLCWHNPDYIQTSLDVTVIDVNSMYPYQMLGYFPSNYRGAWTCKFAPKSVGLWLVNFKTWGMPFIFDVNTRELAHSGKAILDTDTVLFLQEYYDVQIEKGYVYLETEPIFEEFIRHAYKLRLTGDEALSFTAKILMNSLYGKFAQKTESRRITTNNPDGAVKYKIGVLSDVEVFEIFEERDVPHRFVIYSSLVTLRARLHLKKLSMQFSEAIAYCDTDSLHIVGNPHVMGNTDLGGYKCEYTGKAVYLGKKLYELTDTQTVKCKGVPKAALKNVSFVDWLPRQFTFTRFPSILKVVHNNQEFGITYATRTVKATSDSSQVGYTLD